MARPSSVRIQWAGGCGALVLNKEPVVAGATEQDFWRSCIFKFEHRQTSEIWFWLCRCTVHRYVPICSMSVDVQTTVHDTRGSWKLKELKSWEGWYWYPVIEIVYIHHYLIYVTAQAFSLHFGTGLQHEASAKKCTICRRRGMSSKSEGDCSKTNLMSGPHDRSWHHFFDFLVLQNTIGSSGNCENCPLFEVVD